MTFYLKRINQVIERLSALFNATSRWYSIFEVSVKMSLTSKTSNILVAHVMASHYDRLSC